MEKVNPKIQKLIDDANRLHSRIHESELAGDDEFKRDSITYSVRLEILRWDEPIFEIRRSRIEHLDLKLLVELLPNITESLDLKGIIDRLQLQKEKSKPVKKTGWVKKAGVKK